MPEFRPFPGIRYRTDDLDAVTAPPYDVIDPEQRDALMARSEHNAVRLILPGEGDGYERARDLIHEWSASGLLARDHVPTFYAYRMHYTDDLGAERHTVGILGGLVTPARVRRGRRPSPRADTPEGEERPSRPVARDPCEPRSDLGAHPRNGPQRRRGASSAVGPHDR